MRFLYARPFRFVPRVRQKRNCELLRFPRRRRDRNVLLRYRCCDCNKSIVKTTTYINCYVQIIHSVTILFDVAAICGELAENQTQFAPHRPCKTKKKKPFYSSNILLFFLSSVLSCTKTCKPGNNKKVSIERQERDIIVRRLSCKRVYNEEYATRGHDNNLYIYTLNVRIATSTPVVKPKKNLVKVFAVRETALKQQETQGR